MNDILEKQYEMITRDRGNIEGRVVGTFLSKFSLYMDYKINETDFIIEKCRFFFSLGKLLSKTYNEVDEFAIESLLKNNRELRIKYEDYGGYESINNAIKLSNIANIEGYIDELYKNNFLIKRSKKQIFTMPIETDGIEVNPFKDLFPTMSAKEVEEYLIGDLAKDAVAVMNNNIKAESLIIGKEKRQKLKEGFEQGTPYDISFEYTEKEVGISDNDEPKYIYASPYMSSKTNGLGNGGGISVMAGYSGIGKSTYTFFNMILPMVYRGEVAVIYSNEQGVMYFSAMLYSFIASNIFKYYRLTRAKIINGTFNEQEEELMDKIDEFLERRNFDEMLMFYSLEEFDVDEIIRISKGLISHNSASVFLIDTFKSENSSDTNYTGQMIESAKRLDVFGNKFNVKVLLTMQLTPATEGTKAMMSAADLSECKAVKTVCDLLFLTRRVIPELELDSKNKKYFLRPYKLRRGRVRGSDETKWVREYIEFTDKDLEYEYRLQILNKSRRGEADLVMLLRFNGVTGRFDEVGWCEHVYRGNL